MNWESLGAIAAIVFGMVSGIYTLAKDNRSWILELIKKTDARVEQTEKTHASYAEQMTSMLRDHYTARREFEDHKIEQRQDMDEFRDMFRDMNRKIDDLPDTLARRMGK